MDMIQGAEWLVLTIFGAGTVLCVYLVASVQGDLRLQETSGVNTDEEAKIAFITLVNGARKKIDIYCDGKGFPESVYNCADVLNALRERIQEKPYLKVRCLFDGANQELGLLQLAKSETCGKNIEVWYLKGGRPESDFCCQIVDNGRFVYLSAPSFGEGENEYLLRSADRLWNFGTRRRISRKYRDSFEHGLKRAFRAA